MSAIREWRVLKAAIGSHDTRIVLLPKNCHKLAKSLPELAARLEFYFVGFAGFYEVLYGSTVHMLSLA